MQSLERGLAVIRAFGRHHPALTLSEVARDTGLNSAAARRFLYTLVELGYLRSDGREFRLRPAVLDLGHAYLSSLTLPDIALPHLEALSTRVGESSSVAVLEGVDIVYVARVATRRIMTATIRVGTTFPAFATALGRTILANSTADVLDEYLDTIAPVALTARTITDVHVLRRELTAIRRAGWAIVDQELEDGLRSVAAPLRDGSGRVVAAVNVSAPVRRGEVAEILDLFLPPLLETTALIEADLAGVRV